ncbi:hypothetical protein [Rhizobium leguminosarum]|uniref:hypothetical protein n=1 Tax=Rhizobium leguminosarum TaxID=384 RepID=UPI003D00EF2E
MKHDKPDYHSERFRELSIKMRLRMHKASHEIMRAKSQAEADQVIYGEYGTLDLSLLSERMERAEEVAKTVARWQQSGSKLHDVSRLLSGVAEGVTPAIPDMPSAHVDDNFYLHFGRGAKLLIPSLPGAWVDGAYVEFLRQSEGSGYRFMIVGTLDDRQSSIGDLLLNQSVVASFFVAATSTLGDAAPRLTGDQHIDRSVFEAVIDRLAIALRCVAKTDLPYDIEREINLVSPALACVALRR